jgi:hypothetical protein
MGGDPVADTSEAPVGLGAAPRRPDLCDPARRAHAQLVPAGAESGVDATSARLPAISSQPILDPSVRGALVQGTAFDVIAGEETGPRPRSGPPIPISPTT